jgi:hypothetical protein
MASLENQEPTEADDSLIEPKIWTYTRPHGLTLLEMHEMFLPGDPPNGPCPERPDHERTDRVQ